MELRILGPLEVIDDDGNTVDVGGARPQTLLVDLALAHGNAIPADRLIADVWGSMPRPGRNGLQVQVSRLRRLLGTGRIATRGGGYALQVPSESTDAERFERLAADGRRALQAGDAAAAADRLRAALALWRGSPLAEFADAEFARPVITRLVEARLVALEDRIDADLAAGRHGEVVGELEALLQEHPFRERMWTQLMTALYRSGRQADALRAFQRARDLLVDELGVEPGPELQAVEREVLTHDAELALPSASAVDAAGRAGNLPARTTALIGRDADLTAAAELLGGAHRVVTIVGPGGVGKTSLAIEAGRRKAAEVRDGAWLVELASVTDPGDVVNAVAAALGVEGESGRGAAGSTWDRLVQFASRRELLVVLDNCEHLIGECARVAADLLARCPGVRILASSREPLMIGGEARLTLAPLGLDDATSLFVERARAIAPAFSVDEAGRATIRTVCARLDGLPLAVELAAARTRAFAPGELLERLDDRFRLLTSGSRVAAARQQTLRAVVDWSYDLLFDDERRVLARMAVFAGSMSIEAIELVAADGTIAAADVDDIVARLVDKSLVVATRTPRGVRFRLLYTIAQYARERLAGSGELEAVRSRHAGYVASLLEVADADHGALQRNWFATVAGVLDDVRIAMEWSLATRDSDRALAIANGLGWYWNMGGRVDDSWRWLLAAIALDPVDRSARRVRAVAWAGALGVAHDTDHALALGREAIELARAIGDPGTLSLAALVHGSALSDYFNNVVVATALFEEAARAFAAVDNPWSHAMATLLRGMTRVVNDEVAAEEPLLLQAAAMFEAIGNAWVRGVALRIHADLATMRGDYDDAIATLHRAVTGLSVIDSCAVAGELSARLAYVYALAGDATESDRWHAEAIATGERQMHVPVLALTYNLRGVVLRRRMEIDDAEGWHRLALALYTERAVPAGLALALASLGYIAELRGDAVGAERHHRESLEAAFEASDRRGQALALEGLAGVAALRGDAAATGELLGAADALRVRAGGPLPPAERVDVDRALARIDAAAAARAREAGRTEPDTVIERARTAGI